MNNTTRAKKLRESRGDFLKYLKGDGIDIGAGNDPLVVPSGSVRAWDVKDGDASFLSGIENQSYDFVYSSHCLEHLKDVSAGLENWARVIRPGGFLYIVVPDYCIYEKLNWPSMFNGDHKQSFSIDLSRSKVGRGNHFHIVHDLVPLIHKAGADVLEVNFEDDGFNYSKGLVDQTFDDSALCQISVISRKR